MNLARSQFPDPQDSHGTVEWVRRAPRCLARNAACSAVPPPESIAAHHPCVEGAVTAIITFEILAGRRTVHHLRSRVADDVLAYVRQISDISAAAGYPPAHFGRFTIGSVFVQPVGASVCEVAVLIASPLRMHAAAVQVTRHHGRWWTTSLQVG